MTVDETGRRLQNKDAVTRTIRIEPGADGTHYLVEVIERSRVHPTFSWTLFGTKPEAEAGAKTQYEASLKEGFAPIP